MRKVAHGGRALMQGGGRVQRQLVTGAACGGRAQTGGKSRRLPNDRGHRQSRIRDTFLETAMKHIKGLSKELESFSETLLVCSDHCRAM